MTHFSEDDDHLSCEDWAELLAASRVEELSSLQRTTFEAHAKSCTTCSNMLEQYRTVDSVLEHWFAAHPLYVPVEDTSPSINASRQHSLASARHVSWSGRPQVLQVLGLALSIGIGLLVLGLLIRHTFNISPGQVVSIAEVVLAALLLLFSASSRQVWSGALASSSPGFTLLNQDVSRRKDYFVRATTLLTTESPVKLAEPTTREVPGAKPALQRSEKTSWRLMLITAGLLLLVVSAASFGITLLASPGQAVSPSGVSIDGSQVFDINRTDVSLKQQAAQAVRRGQSEQAIALWQQAIKQDSSDAEALIYLEDQHVLASHSYFTLVAGTILSGEYQTIGRADLQGIFIAQEEYNQQARQTGGMQLRLIVAVTTSDTSNTLAVAQQVTQEARKDHTIMGIIGWPTSPTALAALRVLSTANPPLIMVSETATSDDLTGLSPYFFRVVPPDIIQGAVAAKYAEEKLGARRVGVFLDPGNDYSKSLADAFSRKFQADGYSVVKELYTVGKPASLPASIQDALHQQVDLFYFAGYAGDANIFLQHLPSCNAASCLQVMGGDGLYVLEDYKHAASVNFPRLHITTFTFPEQWQVQGLAAPPFFHEYTQILGNERPESDAIFAYDATRTFLHAYTYAQSQGRALVSPQDFRSLTFEGVSGTITFGANGNPTGGSIMVLTLDKGGNTHLEDKEPVSGVGI